MSRADDFIAFCVEYRHTGSNCTRKSDNAVCPVKLHYKLDSEYACKAMFGRYACCVVDNIYTVFQKRYQAPTPEVIDDNIIRRIEIDD